ncbi:UDP-3-O-[3-hydroxymyristoyl] glucosamine N-acyltransferase [Acinetobacter sp. ANC 3929]|uniref:UDP-3-O-(3-hydroxymyristoyl)glucosamine N-acyltransferase n=1 Tax=unclassified Acinetobacter TaxID=196816 RepID=UPI0002CDC3D7|nr:MULTISPECIES: UDP-3-O-(3-hydroxymyristoyl)glucosamine N-acyltransferase [unclassified Acinetobacter]ENW81054.1 UDP-3-O-[3-hydroxymyristoyl] glucosamine N-acyltransferase [Acinetobacter sp. ANC 3929]MCH7351367.1 UDP-3-O-(3-hydroxymyristoyl)glucosamine N-acyltransferase [Acinetobacter sp. NIPH 2023]MCH7355577.1 UDP-3-O-(3-hydroxymyristoyl)glucosamine N-acyltransferase [Acinetobacter sp. NIPH 1958]MCH7358098.1 UDP-3-O-(3-hydroxymyristoyl)glucosamine N-acyltransferase [Acinetobacter sp. NIPH 202
MNRRTYRLEEIAHLVKGEHFGEKDFQVSNLASLEYAQEQHICFVNGEKYLAQAEASHAGAFIVTAQLKQQLTSKQNFIVVDNPYLAFATLTHLFQNKITQRGIESTAQIHPSAMIADDAYIGHYVVIGEHCVVGNNTIIQAHTFLDDEVEIGKDCFIDAHVTITGAAKLQDRVRIHANTVIGSEGFGFAPYQGKWHRIAQLGSVRIGNDVRIGSNCSIDRGALDDTILADGVIIDNLVQIAHNVQIGENTAIAANCGIAGSAKIGKNCIMGGASGVVGHLEITDNVTLTAMSMVTKNISEAGTYSSGMGLFENSHWKKTIVRLRQLADVPLTQITKRLDHMQAQLESLESTFKLRK